MPPSRVTARLASPFPVWNLAEEPHSSGRATSQSVSARSCGKVVLSVDAGTESLLFNALMGGHVMKLSNKWCFSSSGPPDLALKIRLK